MHSSAPVRVQGSLSCYEKSVLFLSAGLGVLTWQKWSCAQ